LAPRGRARGLCTAVLTLGICLLATSTLARDLSGTVRAAAGGRPIAGATVAIPGADLSTETDAAGRFTLTDVPGERFELRVEHPAFQVWQGPIDPSAGTAEVVLEAVVYAAEELVITATGDAGPSIDGALDIDLGGQDLDRRRAATLAATMADLPGVAQRSMGPAPARPVIRGLDGNRLLVLEDGTSTGDLSASSPDHAVIVEPLLAHRIAVIRGPAALQYGSNVIGGVVDVHRGMLPGADIQDWGFGAGVQLESVRDGVAGQLGLVGREGPFVFKSDAVVRRSGDLRTAAGTLGNTGSDGWDLAGGGAWIGDGLELSLAAGRLEWAYGIPGGFLGGHPNGVDIELERTRYDGRLRAERPGLGVERLDVVVSHKNYYHEEIESSGICGVAFGLLTTDAVVKAETSDTSILDGTVLGVSMQHRDLATACLSFLPRTEELSFGGFAHWTREFGPADLQGAVRWDRRVLTPASVDTNKAGVIRERVFDGLSGSVAVGWRLDPGNRIRATLMRTFQSPAVEELFSEGPHLAAYSYEVGNADLDPERSWGGELEYHLQAGGLSLALAAFRYEIDDYIFAADTGELEFGPGDEGFLSLYQYSGLDARLLGAEFRGRVRFGGAWSLGVVASYVRGDLSEPDAGPLPRIPPLAGHLDLEREGERTRVVLTARGAARQDRLGEFEQPTAGWFTCDASFEWEILRGRWFHALVLRGENLLDREYRNHLSRIKSIMPEAGRGVSLLYRVSL
jgi:iron complex outermembrane receptor protein